MSIGTDQRSQSLSARSNRAEKPAPRTLRELRHLRGLQLQVAARRAGLHKARLSELERGVRWPTRRELEALEDVYGLPLRVSFVIVVDGDEGA